VLSLNEGKACDAVIRHLEGRAKAQRSNMRLHDKHPDPDRRVELTFELGSDLYALEHTGIEPFPNFMRMNRDSQRLFEPIIRGVSPTLSPNEILELQIPVGALYSTYKPPDCHRRLSAHRTGEGRPARRHVHAHDMHRTVVRLAGPHR
jgi:hypothetical protein